MRLILAGVLAVLASAPLAHAADGERWSGHLLAYVKSGEPPVASPQEPISFVLDPRKRTVRDLEATVLETTRCLPDGEPTNDAETGAPTLPFYIGETVDSVRPRHYSFAGPVKIVDKSFEIGDGRFGGTEEGAAPGSALFAASVDYDPAGNPGQSFAISGFMGQMLSGTVSLASPTYDGGRCETTLPTVPHWSVKGPPLPRLR